MQYRHKLRNVTGAHKISYGIIISGFKLGEKWRGFIKSLFAINSESRTEIPKFLLCTPESVRLTDIIDIKKFRQQRVEWFRQEGLRSASRWRNRREKICKINVKL